MASADCVHPVPVLAVGSALELKPAPPIPAETLRKRKSALAQCHSGHELGFPPFHVLFQSMQRFWSLCTSQRARVHVLHCLSSQTKSAFETNKQANRQTNKQTNKETKKERNNQHSHKFASQVGKLTFPGPDKAFQRVQHMASLPEIFLPSRPSAATCASRGSSQRWQRLE